MSNILKSLMTASAMCVCTVQVYATPLGANENMVMLPTGLPDEVPAQKPAPAARAKQKSAPSAVAQPALGVMEATPYAGGDNLVAIPDNIPLDKVFVPVNGPNYIEGGVNYHNVSNHVGDWSGQFLLGQVQYDEDDRFNFQLQHSTAFHDEGYLGVIGNNHTFDDKWFSDVSVGVGSSSTFLSRFRTDAAINRRWLEQNNMITTAGVSYSVASETYTNYGFFLGASYYFSTPFILQVGARVDMSNPGQVFGTSEFIALSYGHQKDYYITGRIGYAHEAYQLVGPMAINSEFNSHILGLNWRQWLGEDWGYNVGGEYYKNPYYHRNGVSVSVFKEF